MSKYKAKPTVVDGIRFASQKEARRYGELKVLERIGAIVSLVLQPEYTLNVRCHVGPGVDSEIGVYKSDFAYVDCAHGQIVVEDVKGFKTPLYRWKKKHVEAQYGIRIVEI